MILPSPTIFLARGFTDPVFELLGDPTVRWIVIGALAFLLIMAIINYLLTPSADRKKMAIPVIFLALFLGIVLVLSFVGPIGPDNPKPPVIYNKDKGGVYIKDGNTTTYVGSGDDPTSSEYYRYSVGTSEEEANSPYVTGRNVPPPPTSKLPDAAPLPGTVSPAISAVTVRYDTGIMREPGWYAVEAKLYWKSCGMQSAKTIVLSDDINHPARRILMDNKTKKTCTVVYGIYESGQYSTFCWTWNEIKEVGERYEGKSCPPQYAWVCMWYHHLKNNPPPANKKLCPCVENVRGLSWFIPRDKVASLIGKPCTNGSVDYLIFETRLLHADDKPTPPPLSSYSPYTDWTTQVVLRESIREATAEQIESYKSGGIEFIEVNGYVHAIIPTQSLFSDVKSFLVVNVTILEAAALALVATLVVWWRWLRK